ncbi:MAG: LysR family transcriptional regulator [Elusimicrobia bacterium]|nr:LysR family transcriptional regulator [Elusimicrobiota bacterium]
MVNYAVDLYQLRYFLEVSRTLNFTRAAENLGISTPAVSKSVALLERSVGQPLLTRSRRLVQLTQAGERLKAHAERVYDELEAARLDLRGEAGSPAMLKIGSREMITNYLLGPSLLAFRKQHPATRFGVYELGPREMAAALRKNQIDFGFYYSAEIPDPALEIRRLGRLDSHVYAAPSLWGKSKIPKTFDGVRKLPFIAPRYFGADPSEPSLDGFPDQENPRVIQYEGEFLETHRRFALDGIAAAVLPDFTVKREWKAGLLSRLPGPELGREIFFLKRRGRPLPKSVDEFVETVARSIKRVAY